MLIKQESITSQKLGSWDFCGTANSVLNKDKSAIPPLFNGLEVLPSACDKARLFAENVSNNSTIDDSDISSPVSPSRNNLKLYISIPPPVSLSITTLKLHNISVFPTMVRKVMTNLDLTKAFGPDCIPLVVLNNYEPELSYILAELLNKYLKDSCYPDCCKISFVVPVVKNFGERSTAKNYHPAGLLSVAGKKSLYIIGLLVTKTNVALL